MAEAIDLFWYA